jgi:hypothetical protein
LFNTVLDDLAKTTRKGKEIKGMERGNSKFKLFLFVDDMILFVENTEESVKRVLQLIKEFSKVARYKNYHAYLGAILINQ